MFDEAEEEGERDVATSARDEWAEGRGGEWAKGAGHEIAPVEMRLSAVTSKVRLLSR